jgi:hypothetical protein
MVALVAGTIINLINQGQTVVAGLPVDVAKLLATYFVSYCVCTHGPSPIDCARRGARTPVRRRDSSAVAQGFERQSKASGKES